MGVSLTESFADSAPNRPAGRIRRVRSGDFGIRIILANSQLVASFSRSPPVSTDFPKRRSRGMRQWVTPRTSVGWGYWRSHWASATGSPEHPLQPTRRTTPARTVPPLPPGWTALPQPPRGRRHRVRPATPECPPPPGAGRLHVCPVGNPRSRKTTRRVRRRRPAETTALHHSAGSPPCPYRVRPWPKSPLPRFRRPWLLPSRSSRRRLSRRPRPPLHRPLR